MNMKRILTRVGLRIFPILLFFCIRSRALADMAWEPAPGTESLSPLRVLRIISICIIGVVWLLAKGRMLKCYDGSGWNILIPFYGRYLEYKYYWGAEYYLLNFSVCFLSLCLGWLLILDHGEIVVFAGAAAWVVITVLMRMKTLEAFGQKKFLCLLEFLGLGFVLDCICALACIRNEKEKKQKEKQALQQEKIDNWE